MALYSVHDERNGGFLYYASNDGPAINADFATPATPAGPLGVASIEVARRLPRDAVLVGRGTRPRGSIASLTPRRRRAGVLHSGGVDPAGLGLVGVGGVDARQAAFAGAAGLLAFWIARRADLPVAAQVTLATGAAALVYWRDPVRAGLASLLPP